MWQCRLLFGCDVLNKLFSPNKGLALTSCTAYAVANSTELSFYRDTALFIKNDLDFLNFGRHTKAKTFTVRNLVW